MKNIHVLQTDKPSRIIQCLEVIELLKREWKSPLGNVGRNIYITSDEEIKERDWVLNIEENTIFKPTDAEVYDIKNSEAKYYEYCKKIILTTDQDLIKDGIQSIDDEFLEWFVQNPSCEEVEVSEDYFKPSNMVYGHDMEPYKIITPKEEPKQETLEERIQYISFLHKQNLNGRETEDELFEAGILAGIEETKEIMYSEEEVIGLCMSAYNQATKDGSEAWLGTFDVWFEQFKKK